MLTFQLVNYIHFFEKILQRVTQRYIDEMIAVVEYRHIFGCLHDEDGPVSLEREMAIFTKVYAQFRVMHPLFRMKIIVCGLKIVGKDHIQAMLDAVESATKMESSTESAYQMVCGFDMVNEEDYHMKIDEFLPQILAMKIRMGDKFQLYLHAGESYSRYNKELYDAVLLGSKRIGHGFALARCKNLINLVKEKNVCLECCPVSNRVLGYCSDLRTHPARGLLAQGVKISLSPDDQGFWDAEGVTLDYVLAYVAWGLDLADIKQLCLNSLEFASTDEAHKKQLREFFDYKWYKFLLYIKGRY